MNEDREILQNHFCLIKGLPNQPEKKELVELLESIGQLTINCLNERERLDEQQKEINLIFEPFKNIALLSEEHCKEITNLSKEQFMRVLNLLTRLRDSKNRTKAQLLALYK
jgi:hypothetical protein